MRYGEAKDDRGTLYRARSKSQAPVVLLFGQPRRSYGDPNWALQFLIGGLVNSGTTVIGINLPSENIAEDAASVRRALSFLATRASADRLDLSRVAIVGHGSGAHLASLVATDPSYFESAGLPFAALKGAALLDGALADAGAGLMPQDQAAAPNAPVFLIVHPKAAPSRAGVFGEIAAALRKAGSPVVERTMVSGDGIADTSPSDRTTAEALVFLRNRLR